MFIAPAILSKLGLPLLAESALTTMLAYLRISDNADKAIEIFDAITEKAGADDEFKSKLEAYLSSGSIYDLGLLCESAGFDCNNPDLNQAEVNSINDGIVLIDQASARIAMHPEAPKAAVNLHEALKFASKIELVGDINGQFYSDTYDVEGYGHGNGDPDFEKSWELEIRQKPGEQGTFSLLELRKLHKEGKLKLFALSPICIF